MRYYHRHSFFPVAIILLSLVLGGFMYWSLGDAPSDSKIELKEGISVDVSAYESGLANVVKTFDERYLLATDDLEKLITTETALTSLLALRVPAEYKDVHLGLALSFKQIQAALKEEGRDTQAPLQSIEVLKGEYSWLTQ